MTYIKSMFFCLYNDIQWGPMLFWTPLTFILCTKSVETSKYCIFNLKYFFFSNILFQRRKQVILVLIDMRVPCLFLVELTFKTI